MNRQSQWTVVFMAATAVFHAATSAARVRADEVHDPKFTYNSVEVRGTWITTTANTAIATPQDTAATMKRLREIGLNTVYVETWKNGYTQYPSETLRKVIGVERRPNLMPQDPSDSPETLRREPRDLLEETLIQAHRNGLIYIAWFEYGFMAAHKSTDNHLRRMKPEWLSRDITGNEVAPNGFVWMNPLHPEARRFLLDLVLEAVDKYDLDGVQIDDRIVWPYYTMGYDDYTRAAYASEHGGKQPPDDPKDPGWMRWRADKINEYSKLFVQEVRARRPGLLISLSPAVYPWCWENYLLEWPKWSAWTAADAIALPGDWPGNGVTPRWDEFIPQNYRFTYEAFEKTWLDQVKHMNEMGGGRQRDLIAGIRLVGEGADSSWEQLKGSIDLARKNGNGGHVLWFSRGVLDVFDDELKDLYHAGLAHPARHPKFPLGWRRQSHPLKRSAQASEKPDRVVWSYVLAPADTYRVIVLRDGVWTYAPEPVRVGLPDDPQTKTTSGTVVLPEGIEAAELIVDRRERMNRPRE